ncbi:MAG: response regulator [Lachnospiraceae bacterium]|nr:response regulator [Lachnospiraceae bacterium]
MRYVDMKHVTPGMRPAKTLFDSMGRVLVASNVVLNESAIQKLWEYGFDGIYIEDALSEDIEIDYMISPALRSEGLSCVREQNIDGCLNIAKKIVEEILDRETLMLDLTDLRSFDDYTYAHSVNVAVLCCVIGVGLEMEESDLTKLVTAALIHDLGKMLISPEILNKPGRLTPEEYEIMKSHADLSYELIRDRYDIPSQVKTAVRFHHENVDGSGYPDGLDASQQTIFIKILHVADVYDALTSKRPYKEPYSPYEACEYLMGGCSIMFDQHVVETFLRFVPLHQKGTMVTLSDGREGIIYENSGFHNLRPILRMLDGSMIDLMASEYLNLTIITSSSNICFSPEEAEKDRENMIHHKRYRIMVVDDMKTNLHMLREILEPIYDVALLKSGAQALLYLQKNEYPDLVLMDIDMPEMDGIETTRRIQEMTNHEVPILFVTALCDKETVLTCRSMNAAGYIVRPYKPVYIKSEIKRILQGYSEVS